MTTIVWQPGVLACDKRVTEDNIVSGNGACKAVEDATTVYAVTGTLTQGLRFVVYLQGDRSGKPPRLKSATVIEFDKRTGAARVWECKYMSLPCKGVYAMGSGGQLALGAMSAGASPEEAIRIASKHDAYTGHGVQVWRKGK